VGPAICQFLAGSGVALTIHRHMARSSFAEATSVLPFELGVRAVRFVANSRYMIAVMRGVIDLWRNGDLRPRGCNN
jgi:hypothetical protein